MIRRCALLILLICSPGFPQGTETRAKPAEYPVQASLPTLTLGAEYLVRSVSARNRTFFIPDYLVVEVAVFPAPGQTVAVSSQHFTLHSGGKQKEILSPQSAGFVAASLKYPDWERRRTVEAVAGAGDRGVIVGRPPATERFPGDPTSRTRLPAPPRAPAPEGGAEREEPVLASDVVAEAILPEVETTKPVSGYLYFPFKGKTKSLRSLELVYKGPAGSATLRFH